MVMMMAMEVKKTMKVVGVTMTVARMTAVIMVIM